MLFGPDGARVAVYRKIHLFDVDVSEEVRFKESATIAPGSEVVTAPTELGTLGLCVCYDLRFAELYAALVKKGAQIITVPSAFTLMTGKDHWYALLRARAIETQCYVIAPAQSGKHDDRGLRHSYGHSIVIDPWGQVIGSASDGPGWRSPRSISIAWRGCDGRSRSPITVACSRPPATANVEGSPRRDGMWPARPTAIDPTASPTRRSHAA